MGIDLYKAVFLTDLHAGSGDINYSVIGNEIQKDTVTGYATIHPSGVKGALREYFSSKSFERLDFVFGSGLTEDSMQSESGAYKFFSFNQLARPLRAINGRYTYYLATSKDMLKGLKRYLRYSNLQSDKLSEAINEVLEKDFEDEKAYTLQDEVEVKIEGYSAEKIDLRDNTKSKLISLMGERVIIFNDSTLKDIGYPVVARNCTIEGKENLWYEEIAPRESVFFFAVDKEEGTDPKTGQEFDRLLCEELIQFGGNSSIGYGFANIEKMGAGMK